MASIVLVAAACGGGSDGASDFPLSEEQIDAELAAAGPSQRPFLEDGVVTKAERERAYLNFVACAEAGGIEIYDYQLFPRGDDSFNTRPLGADEEEFEPSGESGTVPRSAGDQVVDDCRYQNYTAVGLLYSYTNRRTGDELREWESDLAACMSEQGVSVPDGSDWNAMNDLDRGVFNECYTEVGR